MDKYIAHILVVDDDDGIRSLVKKYLNENNFLVTTANSAEDASEKISGGDRDGNPNVTAKVTRRVMIISRWQAADLINRDLEAIYEELSITRATDTLRALVGDGREPYRAL